MEKRKEIDFINVLLCLLVMLIHILSYSISTLDKTSVWYAAVLMPSRLASFVVQGFIFISALKYSMRYCGKQNSGFKYPSFMKSRVKTVIAPYILWNIIFYLALIPLGYFILSTGSIKAICTYIVRGDMISHFYFVVVIVQFYLLMPLWLKLTDNFNGMMLCVISMCIMVLFGRYASGFRYNDRIFLKYIFYWIWGCTAGRNYERFIHILDKNKGKLLITFSIFAFADSFGLYINNTVGIIPVMEYIHIAYCIFAIMLVFMLGIKFSGIVDKTVLSVVNRQSYNIYLSHCLVLYYCNYLLNYFGIYSAKAMLLARFVLCYAVTLIFWSIYDVVKRKISC